MKSWKLILATVFIVLVSNSHAADKDKEKKRFEALFKSILVKAGKYDRTLLETIADGGADDVKLISKKETIEFKTMSDAKWQTFVDQNFRSHKALVKLIDVLGIDYASRKDRKISVFAKRNDDDKAGDGMLITFKLIMPKTDNPALDPDLKPAFRTVRFLEYNGKTYWIPFGW